MAQPTDKFYNMRINLIKNGRIYSEAAAVKNVWRKSGNIFLDIYFHRLKKSFVFDAVFIHDILDVSRDKSYKDIKKFVADFEACSSACPEAEKHSSKKSDIFAPITDDILLLLFLSRIWDGRNMIKSKIIIEYIQTLLPAAKNMSEQYLRRFLSTLHPENDDFYGILGRLKAKKPQQAVYLLEEAVKICLVDGYLHYNERMYLADLIQALRIEGVKIPQDII